VRLTISGAMTIIGIACRASGAPDAAFARSGLADAAESATGKSKNYAFFDHPAV
jgi:hypothetical protein